MASTIRTESVGDLWSKGYKVRSARKQFNNGTRTYARGSLVVLMGRNMEKKNWLKKDMASIAEIAGVTIEAFKTGRMKEGIDFGSGNMVPLKQPKIGLMVDTPFNSYTGRTTLVFTG
ncbi:MAG: hypothetical protein Ct9H300mP29_1370 [Candidatus Neomarinimicrobiota bacterium]|nr:MAG: hypothetical protein Ct9H300mP29_1370 [Candidatus Neomarinimicrobiota bacterium]